MFDRRQVGPVALCLSNFSDDSEINNEKSLKTLQNLSEEPLESVSPSLRITVLLGIHT